MTQSADSKAQCIVIAARKQAPITVYERLWQGLERMGISLRVL
jgi:hypothetical protein